MSTPRTSRIRTLAAATVGTLLALALAGCSGVVTKKSQDPADTVCPYVLHLQDVESGVASEVCVSEQEYRGTPIGTQWGEENSR